MPLADILIMLARVITPSLFGLLSKRGLKKVAKNIDIKECPGLSKLVPYFHELQTNITAHQSEIAKVSSFYRNLDPNELLNKNLLNGALYFSALFCKKISNELISAAYENVDSVQEWVLKVLAQKLLRSNQWPTAEKLINQKFRNSVSKSEIMKFEVLALNGNFKNMIEQLPHLAKSGMPPEIHFRLICLLNSSNGKDFLNIMRPKRNESTNDSSSAELFNLCANEWVVLLQLALKGRLLSSKPPTFDVFLRLAKGISLQYKSFDPSLLLLATTKCTGISSIITLDFESSEGLKAIYKLMPLESLISLASKLQAVEKTFPEEIVSLLLQHLCNHSIGVDYKTLSALFCWIIRFCPEKYPFELLMTEYSELIDHNVAKTALKSIGLFHKRALTFVEYCMMNKGISVDPKVLSESIDISIESFGSYPSEEFLKHIHLKGHQLSSRFYLKHLKWKLSTKSIGLNRAFECFRLIYSESLHGELLQQYLQIGQSLLDLSMKESNLDVCLKLYQSTSKFQLLQSLTRPKSFKEFIKDNYENGKFMLPFKSTINLKCIDAALECVENSKKQIFDLDERFCATAIRSALINSDFKTAQRLRMYMNNYGYCDGGLLLSKNVLQQWLNKIK